VEQLHLKSSAQSQPAQKLSVDISKYLKLDKSQADHIRHFHNFSARADGEWHHMGTQELSQEILDARYQLAIKTYAAGGVLPLFSSPSSL